MQITARHPIWKKTMLDNALTNLTLPSTSVEGVDTGMPTGKMKGAEVTENKDNNFSGVLGLAISEETASALSQFPWR